MEEIIGAYQKNGYFIGMDAFQADEIAKFPTDKPLCITVKESRNVNNHRRFFAFINTAFDMQEHYSSKEHLRKMLLMKAGFYERIESHKDGKFAFIPSSMKFERMSEKKFRDVFKACINAFHEMLSEMNISIGEDELMRIMDFE